VAKLIITAADGGSSERELSGKAFTVGRSADCDLPLKGDAKVSRSHCKIEPRGDEYFLSDLGSANGTRLNGEKIGQQVLRLEDGDRIGVGGTKIEFWLAEPAPDGGAGAGAATAAAGGGLAGRLGKVKGLISRGGPRAGAAGATFGAKTITCSCGAVINTADRAPGHKVGCPRCKKIYKVPRK